MADERLDAGRHHLHNGRRALELGYVDEARAHFAAARLQFRGPELRLGEAHAVRGLGQVAAAEGDCETAEGQARRAIADYQDLLADLREVDDPLAVDEIRIEAAEGEAASWVLVSEALLLRGRVDEAAAALQAARARLDGLPQRGTAATVWMALGRLSWHREDPAGALSWFERALEVQRTAADVQGQVVALIAIAEVHRHTRDHDAAHEALGEARELVRDRDEPSLEGRVLAALGGLSLESGHPEVARSFYEDALGPFRRAADVEREGLALVGLGSAASRVGDPGATDALLDGARRLARSGHHAGLPLALYRLALHARRTGRAGLALVAAEGARRRWAGSDPVRGQGQALRILVKALNTLGRGRAALVAALAREALAGASQPNAVEVARWFRERAPADAVAELERLDTEALLERARLEIIDVLTPPLQAMGWTPDALDDPQSLLAWITSLAHAGPDAPPANGAAVVQVMPGVAAGAPDEAEEPPSDAEPAGAYVSLDELYGSLYDGADKG